MKALKVFLWMTLILGLIYPLLITAIAQTTMHHKANGSMMTEVGSHYIGSSFIGQKFTSNGYFWSRPSSVDYNPLPSGGSNLGPISPALKKAIEERMSALSKTGPPPFPADLLFASGSGLDPHISPMAAYFQVERVAKARGVETSTVRVLISKHTQSSLFGRPCVNVLELNLDLDETCARRSPKS